MGAIASIRVENFDSDFSEVSGELEDLIRQNLKTADPSDPEPEESVSRHRGGVAASRLSLVLTLLPLTVVGYLMRSESSPDFRDGRNLGNLSH